MGDKTRYERVDGIQNWTDEQISEFIREMQSRFNKKSMEKESTKMDATPK